MKLAVALLLVAAGCGGGDQSTPNPCGLPVPVPATTLENQRTLCGFMCASAAYSNLNVYTDGSGWDCTCYCANGQAVATGATLDANVACSFRSQVATTCH